MIKAISARVSQPNTPETDAMEIVWHTVTLSDGRELRVLAMDPIDAINKANKLLPFTQR